MWALRGLVAEVGALAIDLAPRSGVWGVGCGVWPTPS